MAATLSGVCASMREVLYIAQPLFLMLLAGLWVACIVDALRQHRPWLWVVLLVFVPPVFPIYWLNFRVWNRGHQGLIDAHLADARRLRELTAELRERDVAGVRRDIADIHFRHGRFREAIEHLKPVLEFTPEDLRSQYQAGVAMIGIGRPELAESHLEFVVEQDARFQRGEARLALARALQAQGKNERAFDQLAHLLEEYAVPEAAVRLARLMVSQGYADRARATLEKLFERVGADAGAALSPDDHKWLRTARRELDALATRGDNPAS